MGGQVWISKPKTSLRGSSSTLHTSKARALGHPAIVMTHKFLPIRTIAKDGVQTYRVKLPRKVARSLKGLTRAQLAKRVDVQIWNDKDVLAGVPGADLRQHASAFPPGTLPKTKSSGRRESAGASSSAGRQFVRSAPMDNNNNGISTRKNTPGNLVIYNGSPFDMTYNVAELSCMSINNSTGALTTATLAAGASAQYSMVGYPNGGDGTNYDSDAPSTGASAWNTIAAQAAANISASVAAGIAGGFARPKGTSFIAAAGPVGLATFGAGLLVNLIEDAISASSAGNGCQDGGSAFSVNWTVKALSSSQTAGNVSYWVPSYSASTPVQSGGVSVAATAIPITASGSPVSAYQATSSNGLALSAPVLQSQVGLSGSLVLETSNGGNAAFNTGKWAGCDFSNQQSPNPNSSNPNAPYGLSGFSGGVTADWGPCADWIDEIDCSGLSCPDTVAESVTVLLGYSNTAGQVGVLDRMPCSRPR